jgi:DNA-binding NarL/FixJ family response regulator
MAIRVVVGEDSLLVREGVATILSRLDGIDLVETARDLDELRMSVERTAPDVVVTDIRMPPTNSDEGIRFADELRSSHPEIGVVILSMHAEPRYATDLLRDGSDGRAYLLKERLTDEAELSNALHAVAAGESVIDPQVVEKLVAARERRTSQLDALTPRELEILGLIAQGRSNRWIASKLTITKRAVERHINAIFVKLDLGEPEDVNRRVRATLLYLSGDETGA